MYSNQQEVGLPLKIKDEGVTLIHNTNSIDFKGDGVSGSLDGMGGAEEEIPGGGSSSDEKVKLSASDPTAGYLNDKIQGAEVAHITGATYKTLQKFIDLSQSAGRISGGVITDAGSNTINVSAGTGWVRIADDDTSTLKFFDWSASNGIAINMDSTNEIYVDYNSGSPVIANNTTGATLNLDTQFPLGTVVRDNNHIHIINNPYWVSDSLTNIIQRFDAVDGRVARDNSAGGLILGETGTRNITMTAGITWARLNDYAVSAIDTSGSDTFDIYYRDGSGGWTPVHDQTQWDNQHYDNGTGTLANLGANRYTCLWFYIETDGDLVMLYGSSNTGSLQTALNEAPPASVPARLTQHGLLIGRLVIREGNATATEIQSAFSATFNPAETTQHNELGGLQGGTAGEYYHLTSAEKIASTIGTMTFIIGDNKSVINAGTRWRLQVPSFNGIITGWRLSSTDVLVGSIVVDVRKIATDTIPTSGDSIAGSEKPTLTNQSSNSELDLDTFTPEFSANDWIWIYVESVTDLKQVTLTISFNKS